MDTARAMMLDVVWSLLMDDGYDYIAHIKEKTQMAYCLLLSALFSFPRGFFPIYTGRNPIAITVKSGGRSAIGRCALCEL